MLFEEGGLLHVYR